jgi:hypothetical protein
VPDLLTVVDSIRAKRREQDAAERAHSSQDKTTVGLAGYAGTKKPEYLKRAVYLLLILAVLVIGLVGGSRS